MAARNESASSSVAADICELFDHQLVGRGKGLYAGHQPIQVVVPVELVGSKRISIVGKGCVGRGGLL